MRTPINQYDFKQFIQEVKDMDYLDIIKHAEKEANRVESRSFSVKGAVKEREQGSMVYVRRISAFLFWMKTGTRPAGATNEDFQSYKVVAEQLVAKKQFKPTVLDAFE